MKSNDEKKDDTSSLTDEERRTTTDSVLKELLQVAPPNGAGRRAERNRVYKELRSPRLSDSGSGGNEGNIPRRFRRNAGKYSKVLLAGQKYQAAFQMFK
jgi:hypothetical protein